MSVMEEINYPEEIKEEAIKRELRREIKDSEPEKDDEE